MPAGVEVALGIWRDPLLGPLVLVAAGGTLVELLDERAVALPPVDAPRAESMIRSLKVADLLAGHRGGPELPIKAVVSALVGLSELAHELGESLRGG